MSLIRKMNTISRSLWKKGAFHIFMGSFLTKFVAFFGSIFLVRILSKTSYGQLGYIENIYGYIHIFIGMGLGNAILRYVIRGETLEEKFTYYKYAIRKGTIFNLLIVVIIGVLGFFYTHPEGFQGTRYLLILILIALPFQYLTESNQLTLRAMFDNKKYAFFALLSTTLMILGRYFSALYYGIIGVIASKIIISLLFAIILSIIVYKTFFLKTKTIFLNKAKKKEIDIYSLQYMMTNGLWTIFMLNDTFLLGRLGGNPAVLADYKVAYVLPGNLSIVSASIGLFIVPYFISRESDIDWVRNKYLKVFGFTAGLIAIAVIFLFVFSKPIINLLYGSQYENIIPVMRLLLVATFFNNGLRFTSANLLSAMGEVKYNLRVSFVGVIVQIIMNLLLIPRYGAMGAAVTSIIVYAIMALVLFIIFVKKYNIFAKK